MKVFSVTRFLWLVVLLFVAALAISSVQSLNEDKSDERLSEEFEETLDNFDYDAIDESDIDKQDYVGQPPPLPIPPQMGYSSPQYYEQPSYAPLPLPPAPKYQEPAYVPLPPPPPPPPKYEQPAAYVPPPPPPPPPPKYEQPAVSYPAPAYQAPKQTYQAQVANYSATYAPLQPNYQPAVSNYSQLVSVPTYAAQQQAYQAPVANYSAPAAYPSPQPINVVSRPANYSAQAYSPPAYQQPNYSPAALAQKYSLTDLAPYTMPFGYRGNHWTLHYYRPDAAYQSRCPKRMYTGTPAYKDIEQAFAFALQQLGQLRSNVNYMNSTLPSFAARHQIFSFLSQQSARMDEEGLLVEFVGLYLADRLCLSKWDKQRYLPSLTRVVSASNFPKTHSCSQYYSNPWQASTKNCYQSKYRTFDGFCNNPYHPYWGKSNVCHIRLLSPDYADGISLPRQSLNGRYELPNPRVLANVLHSDLPVEGPYNLMKMQWGQLINHDISNTALSSYDGLVDCCKQPQTRGCWPIMMPVGDRFYTGLNVTCLNFIRSGVCPTCQLGPRQQTNKNTAFLDASHVYGNNLEQANQLRAFVRGQLRTSGGRNGEVLLPISTAQEQCSGTCYHAGDSRVNQHPALTVLHTLLLRNHNRHAHQLSLRHPNWSDEILFQEARRINIAEYQMITYNEYLPIVFGPILSAYYHLVPQRGGYTQFNPKVDPTSWNEYTTASCRFGHSQITSTYGMYSAIISGNFEKHPSYRLKDWYMRPTLLGDGMLSPIVNGLLSRASMAVDPWVTTDVRNHLYQSPTEKWGGDLAATNIWRGRDHGLPGYVHYLEYCFNHKVRGWKDLHLFIPPASLLHLRKLYRIVENIDLFVGGLVERHFPGADIGPTFACINGIQYNHLKYGDRFYFEHGGQAGSFTPIQLEEIRRSTLARFLCRTAALPAVPQYAFLHVSQYNPLINCSQVGDIDYGKF